MASASEPFEFEGDQEMPPPVPVAACPGRKREAGSPSAERPSKVLFSGGWTPPVCSTCGQTARQPDQFHPENITLYWPKKGKNQAGHLESYPHRTQAKLFEVTAVTVKSY
eukprot:s684_g14.t1